MERTLVALSGKSNSGKTTTVTYVYEILSREADCTEVEPERVGSNRADFLAILVIRGMRVGLVTAGDIPGDVEEWLARLTAKECVVIVCATHTRGGTVEAVKKLKPTYCIEWITQAERPGFEQERANRATAKRIVDKVRRAIAAEPVAVANRARE